METSPKETLTWILQAQLDAKSIEEFIFSPESTKERGMIMISTLTQGLTITSKLYYNNKALYLENIHEDTKDFYTRSANMNISLDEKIDLKKTNQSLWSKIGHIYTSVLSEHKAMRILQELEEGEIIKKFHIAKDEEKIYGGYDFVVTQHNKKNLFLDIASSEKALIRKNAKHTEMKRFIHVVCIPAKKHDLKKSFKKLKKLFV